MRISSITGLIEENFATNYLFVQLPLDNWEINDKNYDCCLWFSRNRSYRKMLVSEWDCYINADRVKC